MNASQQSPLAPFLFRGARREMAPHGKALGLQRGESGTDGTYAHIQRIRNGLRRDGTLALEPPANDLRQSFVG